MQADDSLADSEAAARERRPAASRLPTAALAVLLAVYAFLLFANRSRSVGGSDSSGYMNLAKAMAAGELVQPIEPLARLGFPPEDLHLFIPLGYVPGPRPGTMSTFYPPGLPLQIVPAALVLGWWRGPFLLSPAFAVGSVLLLYLLGRDLGLSRAGALACSAALAASPVLAFQGVQLMSDAAATAWALATVLFAVKARRHVSWSAVAGFAFGVGVLVRPASALMIVPLLFALPARPRAWILFGAGGFPCAAYLLVFNRICYGAPGRTGYGAGGALADFAIANFPARFRHYLFWISMMMTPLVPAGWLLFAGDSSRAPRLRAMLVTWFAVFFLFYCFYGPYETWWYTRFLLPALPALLLASAMLAEDILGRLRERAKPDPARTLRARRIAGAAAVLATVVVCGAGVRMIQKFDVFKTGRGQALVPESIRWASSRVPQRSVVLAMEFSGAMRAYGWGTFLRWDFVEGGRFLDIRRRLQERGYGIYALMLPHEVTGAAPRLPGEWTYLGSNRDVSLWRLDSPPL